LVGELNKATAPYPQANLDAGFAFVFLARERAGGQGHTAFAVQTGPKHFLYCSMDSKPRYKADGSSTAHFHWNKGEDSGAWCREGSFEDMIEVFRNDPGDKPYSEFRYVGVSKPKLRAVTDMARQMYDRGYDLVGNNCTDVVWDALTQYGVKDVPLLQTRPVPNAWFDKLGTNENLLSRQVWSSSVKLH
jgi:hypothetical protein